MRIALISTLETDPRPGEARAAFRQFGALRLVERQLQLALAAGCTSIICLADTIGREVIELQHRAEQAGARFMVAREGRKLLGFGTTADEILVLAGGLLPDDEAVLKAIERPVILTLPSELGVPLGYERIDADTSWAGVMLANASLVERLAGLPEDADPISSLLRLGLQAGVRRVAVDRRLLDGGVWHLAPTQEVLVERASRWVQTRAALAPFSAPGLAVAERMGARLSRDLLGRAAARIPTVAGLASGAAALGSALLEMPVAALMLAMAMSVFIAMGDVIERVSVPIGAERQDHWLTKIARWAGDPLLVTCLALAAPEADGWLRFYVPAAMALALRLGARWGATRARPAFGDRILLSAGFVVAAFFGVTQPLAAAVTIVALLALYKSLATTITTP